MQQPHKNLFFSYRGPVPRNRRLRSSSFPEESTSDWVFDRQLEDNATRALVYVLEHGDRSRVLAPFLKSVAGIGSKARLDEVQFALQRVDIARPSLKHRIALTIAPVPGLTRGHQGSHSSGRPDAWIWLEGNFGVLVEAKVHGQASVAQLRRHAASADGWSWNRVRVRSATWAELYELFQNIRSRGYHLDQTTDLLLDEFVGYLRMIGLSSATTFDLEDFGYFVLPTSDRDNTQRGLLRRKLMQFTEQLGKTQAMRRVIRRYAGKATDPRQYVSPGMFRKDAKNFWITVGPKERRDRCHFNVRIDEAGIALEVFSPHKSFTRRLLNKIKTKPGEFVESLSPMKRRDPYVIRLREAYYHDPKSPYKGQRISQAVDFIELHPRVVTVENLWKLIVEPMEVRLADPRLRPEMFLVRSFGISELVGDSDVVTRLASAAAPMLRYLDFALDLDIS